MSCLPYRSIDDIKGTIKLENCDDDELTKEEIKIILYEINGIIEKFEAYQKQGTTFSFDIDEWVAIRKGLVKKLKKILGD
jgi:hypothetical protein